MDAKFSHALIARLVQSLAVLLVMSVLVYGLMSLMPGDPLELMLAGSPDMTTADADRLRALHGLDQPFWVRYGGWLAGVVSGDWGLSRLYSAPVWDVIGQPLRRTLILMGLSIPLALAVALPLGIWAACRPGSWGDRLVNIFAFATVSVPVFWLGLMAIVLFAVTLGWLPAGGIPVQASADQGGTWATVLSHLRYLAMPVCVLALGSMGPYVRHMRSAMITALQADHIRTARAKGASSGRILRRHALRAALLPVVTVLALDFGALLSGALITETVFAYPGMGKLTYDAIMGNDYALAMACLLLATAVTLAANGLADLAYRLLDPRTREARHGR